MTETMLSWVSTVLTWLAVPEQGLLSVFVVAFISGTVFALPTEAVLVTLIYASAELAWPACVVATLGGTLGGVLTWWMGYGARQAFAKDKASKWETKAKEWLERWGAPACILTWVPLAGDVVCLLAGWLRLPFGSCMFYMALGKGLRYALVVAIALQFF